MKKFFTPEIRIALVAIVGVIILFFGMQFLKGLSLFSSENIYKIKFGDISGLSVSSPIYANGFQIGTIKNVEYNYDHPGDITVDADVDRNMKIPNGTTAVISSDLMGNVKVNLVLGDARNGFIAKGGTINGSVSDGLMGVAKGLFPAIERMIPKVDSILSNVNALLADPAIAGSLHNVNRISSDLTTSTKELNQLLASVNQQFPRLVSNANGMLEKSGGVATKVSGLVENANGLVTNLNSKINEVDLNGTMTKVDNTLNNMQNLTEKLNSNEGSLGLLMNDPGLYNSLHRTLSDADSLVVNLKAHPKRYVHFSLFGKKDK